MLSKIYMAMVTTALYGIEIPTQKVNEDKSEE
jgi:hypothetical protein